MVTQLSTERLVETYRRMLRIRGFDEKAIELVRLGEVPGAVHTTIGQEAEVVGACMALRNDDYMVGNHRSHGHPIGKGASLGGLMAELLGRSAGVNRGKSGSMHLADFSVGSVGETSIVGSGIPVAAGAALGARMMATDRVSLCFFGDGASNEGAFHEGLNLAAIWNLPVVYLCENNRYAVTTASGDAMVLQDIAERARAYGIPGATVDGQDPIAVYEAVDAAVNRARSGQGPSLIEAKTYRFLEHAEGLPLTVNYRSQDEVEEWRRRDPIPGFRQYLIGQNVLSEDSAKQVEAAVQREIEDAVEHARGSPYLDLAEAFEGVYSNPIGAPRHGGLTAGEA